MSLQSLILVLVVLVGWMSLAVLGQSVSRSGSNEESSFADSEVDSGGQSRNVYSPKHLSPHKMMHFGKRLLVQQAPGIYTTTTNQVLDLFHRQPSVEQQQQQQLFDEQQQQQELQPAGFPYTLYFTMPRDRVLESVQPDSMARNRQVKDVLQNLLGLSRRQQQQQQLAGCEENSIAPQQQQQQQQPQQQQFRRANQAAQPKLLRLVKSDGPDSNESASPSANDETSQAGQQEQQDSNGSNTSNGRADGDEIDRSSRSVGAGRPLLPGLTRAQFSMLFGGQPPSSGSQASLLNFIKKAEPQRMTFMHFGRRR